MNACVDGKFNCPTWGLETHSLVAAVEWNTATRDLIRLEKAHMDRCVQAPHFAAMHVYS